MRKLSRRQWIKTLGGTVGSAMVLAAIPPPENPVAPVLRVKEAKDSVEVDNGLVKARFRKLPGGIDQEYSARRADGKCIPVVKSFRPERPRRNGCAPLYTDQNVAGEYRLLAADTFRTVHVAQKAEGQVQVELRGEFERNQIEQSVSLERGEGPDQWLPRKRSPRKNPLLPARKATPNCCMPSTWV